MLKKTLTAIALAAAALGANAADAVLKVAAPPCRTPKS